jgi:hypothetical protein
MPPRSLSRLPVYLWHDIPTLADAILDRVTHNLCRNAQTAPARTIRSTSKQTKKIIFPTRQDAAVWPTLNRNPGRLQIGAAGGFKLECMAGFPKPSSAVPSSCSGLRSNNARVGAETVCSVSFFPP